jgi:hypothetical protein
MKEAGDRRFFLARSARVLSGMFDMVPLVGIELTTFRLQGGCSTN